MFVLDADGKMRARRRTGETGMHRDRGPQLFAGISIRARRERCVDRGTRAPVRGLGWLDTGDLRRVDTDGYLWLSGRGKELIIRGGHNIDPRTDRGGVAWHPASRSQRCRPPGRPCRRSAGGLRPAARGHRGDRARRSPLDAGRIAVRAPPRQCVSSPRAAHHRGRQDLQAGARGCGGGGSGARRSSRGGRAPAHRPGPRCATPRRAPWCAGRPRTTAARSPSGFSLILSGTGLPRRRRGKPRPRARHLAMPTDHRPRVAAEKRERMRRRLFESALQLVASKGPAATTNIDDVIQGRRGLAWTSSRNTSMRPAPVRSGRRGAANEIIWDVRAPSAPRPGAARGRRHAPVDPPGLGQPAGRRLPGGPGLARHGRRRSPARFRAARPAPGDPPGPVSAMPMQLALNVVSMTVLGSVHAMLAPRCPRDYAEQAVASAFGALGLEAQEAALLATAGTAAPQPGWRTACAGHRRATQGHRLRHAPRRRRRSRDRTPTERRRFADDAARWGPYAACSSR